jgi:hypothetical protein
MKIECKLKREGGSSIEIGGTTYEFLPDANGAHVAEVANTEHAERFLAIPEAYGIHGKTKAAPAPVVNDEEESDEGNEGDQENPVDVCTEDEIAEIKEAYREKFGKAPHHSMKVESIIAKLEAE